MEIGKILDHIIDKDEDEYKISNTLTIKEAAKKISNKYNLVAVTDANQKINQVVSDTDITYTLSSQDEFNPNKTLDNIHTRNPYRPIHAKDKVKKLLETMIQNRMNSVVIVDDVGKYYGIINKNKLKEVIDDFVE